MEHKVKVKEWNIHYIKSGHGSKYLLYLIGGLGNGLELKPVIQRFDPDKFTVVAWDPPGYGMSRPPNRVLSGNFYEEDAIYAYEFMKALNIPSYSVMGNCGGARVAMILAAQHPDLVESLVLLSAKAHVLPNEIETIKKNRDLKNRPPKALESLKKLYNYSDEEVQTLIASRADAVLDLYSKKNNDICGDILPLIQCKTLILNGAKDPITDESHGSYMSSRIKNARLYVYPEGSHKIHITHTEDVVERAQQFLLE